MTFNNRLMGAFLFGTGVGMLGLTWAHTRPEPAKTGFVQEIRRNEEIDRLQEDIRRIAIYRGDRRMTYGEFIDVTGVEKTIQGHDEAVVWIDVLRHCGSDFHKPTIGSAGWEFAKGGAGTASVQLCPEEAYRVLPALRGYDERRAKE